MCKRIHRICVGNNNVFYQKMSLNFKFDKNLFIMYITVLLMIVNTGSIVRMYDPRICLLLYVLFSFILKIKKKNTPNSSIQYLRCIGFLMCLTCIYNKTYTNTYISFLLLGLASYWLITSVSFIEFKKIFLNVVFVLSTTSLCVFFLSQSIQLPLMYKLGNNVDIGHFMFHTITWNNSPLNRNAGIYTEPGGFQFCLNYTLLLYIENFVNRDISNKTILKLFIIIFTIISCASTTGYLVLMLILIYVVFMIRMKHKVVVFPLLLFLGCIMVYYLYTSDVVKEKLSVKNENASTVMRTADAKAALQMINESPFFGNGSVDTNKYKQKIVKYGALTGDHGASNGILVPMAVLGIPWFLIFIYYNFKACKRLYTKVSSLYILFLILLIHTNEYFTFLPITYIYIFQFKKNPSLYIQSNKA